LVLCLLIVAVHAIPATSRRDLLEDKDSTATSTSGRLLVALSKDGAAAAHSGSSSSLNSLSASIASAAGAANVKLLRNINMAILESVDVSLTVAALGSNPNVKSSGPDSTVQVAGVPNDELWNTLWGMDKIEMPAAWGITTGSSSVVVCVIDTGE
jgi:serine protease